MHITRLHLIILLFVLLNFADAIQAQDLFQRHQITDVAGEPIQILDYDFDNDGDFDILVLTRIEH